MAGWVVVVGAMLVHGPVRAGEDLTQGAASGAVSTSQTNDDQSNGIKPFTITATLREEYDDNIFTAKDNKVGSFKTDFSPSVLVDIPMEDSDFSARYTFGIDYYENRPGGSTDLSHNFVAQYKHSFSERFSLNVADQFLYSTEPSLLAATGTLYRNGAYYTNTVNAGFTGQWTPLFGTTTTYSNTLVRYEDSVQSYEQDSMENTGAQNFNFAILPKVTLVFGGIVDDISYDHITRGYTSYTGNMGLDWQVLPTLSLGGRVGGSYTETHGGGTGDLVSPYGAVTLNWQLGARSAWSFNYVHEVVPSDVYIAQGQMADRFDTTFKYDITPQITAHLEGIYTYGQYAQLLDANTISGFDENDLALDSGVQYHVNPNFDVEAGYLFTDVSSGLGIRDYTRNQVYIGVRGTY